MPDNWCESSKLCVLDSRVKKRSVVLCTVCVFLGAQCFREAFFLNVKSAKTIMASALTPPKARNCLFGRGQKCIWASPCTPRPLTGNAHMENTFQGLIKKM